MSLWQKIKEVLGLAPASWSSPDNVKVRPPEYAERVRLAYWHAVSMLGERISDRRHNIKKVDVRPGTDLRPGGWALPCKSSPTGWAGGWREAGRLVFVCNPITGEVRDAVMAHEWAHVLMDLNSKIWGIAAQHAAMREAGLM